MVSGMMPLLSVLLLGFFLGMRHATDPDHVIAVTTIVSRQRSVRAAAWTGVLWGLGHTLTILAVGGAIIVFGSPFPRVGSGWSSPSRSCWSCWILTLTGVTRRIQEARAGTSHAGGHEDRHVHPHVHGDYVHSHVHGHAPEAHGHVEEATPQARLDCTLGQFGAYQILRPLVVGLVHGLAGSAAVALVVLAVIRDPWWAIGYLLVFGVGTIAGMMLITAAVAVPFAVTARRFAWLNRHLATASGLLSLAFGLWMAYQIGVVDGLFSAVPHWSPE
jgi:high-affinity nickel-transport protein